jgi:hypothetical protein
MCGKGALREIGWRRRLKIVLKEELKKFVLCKIKT